MSDNQLIKDAEERLKPQYQHADRNFPVPSWHVVAEALKLGWGFPYEFSTSPSGSEATVSFDPESGRTASFADARTNIAPEVEAWFDHETDPYGSNPEYFDTDPESLSALVQGAAYYLAEWAEEEEDY